MSGGAPAHVQRASSPVADGPRGIARAGLGGPLQAFPYAERIASAFGGYAPVGARAAIGGRAGAAVQSLNAGAYAFGNRAAFPRYPSLEVAVHEAAHIAAAQRGVKVPGGIGTPGDRHERVADDAARAVASGRSAEPVFEAAYGDAPVRLGGEPQLQMYNEIVDHNAPKKETPWKQISDQLDLDASVYNIDTSISTLSSPYSRMIFMLGDACDRADWVKAKLDGHRHGDARTGDETQTAYGNLGNFMSLITNTPTPPGDPFEGGHLVSDQILGDYSYEQYNFAPQRKHLNSPHYRQIEALADTGAVDAGTGSASASWDYDVEVFYDAPTTRVPTATVKAQLGIPDAAIQTAPEPPDLVLTTWVPHLWKAKLSADAGHVFSGFSTVDTANTSGVAKGYLPSEAAVEAKTVPQAGAALAETQSHIDTTYWSMDTMRFAVTGGAATARNTGENLDRQRVHTWTGSQSPPRSQAAQQAGGPVALPPAAVPTVPVLPFSFSSDLGWLDMSLPAPAPLSVAPSAEPPGKRNDRLARDMGSIPMLSGKTLTELKAGMVLINGAITNLRTIRKADPHARISKRDLASQSMSKGPGKAKDKRRRTSSLLVTLGNLAPETEDYFEP